ncbi:sulfite exporter TauE/SafE family protein [Vibrio sp. SCSIO 43137]|uniref:sulfite exporter TauE/SafE family protein n=1 Tax=Vibrio sp. SCSIO 43137 TaxID=3021011 RepID=UPI0023081BCD|nr:sulfite exporter TauE/SafE family protein [Vibrio sp. SCSIO 43137]WCE30469.1 sulfite exporter TauE/SafE family protein [Vibrio sp. SCSIO 43137]
MDILLTLFSFDCLIKVILGFFIGLCLGLTGVGGGVLIIPILQVVFGMPVVMAVGTASIISSIVKANAGLSHIIAGNVEWRALRWMLLGAVPATFITTEVIIELYKNPVTEQFVSQTIELAIITIMLLSLYSIYRKYKVAIGISSVRPHSNKMALSAGITCGTVLGSTGIGGGVMLLPAFNTLLGVSIKKSVGSSLVMALVLSSLTALIYSRSGQSDITTAFLMSLGAFIGVPVAMRVIKKLDDKNIYAITVFIISISLLMIVTK